MEKNDIFRNLWTEAYRPAKLDDLVLSEENRTYFESIKDSIPNLMFAGPNGIGKTSLAKIIAKELLDCSYLYINASEESGIDTIRSKIITFAQTRSIDGKIKVVILDEADGLSAIEAGKGHTSAQGALRNVMEEYAQTTRFILTCNYPKKIIKGLHSRCQTFDLTPEFVDSVKRCIDILKAEGIKVENGDRDKLIEFIRGYYPDLRKTIGELQKFTISSKLEFKKTKDDLGVARNIFDKIINKESEFELRKYVIENEVVFSNDYHFLLKSLFNIVYENKLDDVKKRLALLTISEGMYKHQTAMDPEINCYACLLALFDVF